MTDDEREILCFINHKFHELKHEIINDLHLRSEHFVDNLEQIIKTRDRASFSGPDSNASKTTGPIPEKGFRHRDSLLTDMFNNKHIRTFRNVIGAFVILFFNKNLVYDWVYNGKINTDFQLVYWNFNGFFKSMLFVWLPMLLSSLYFVYIGVKMWAISRRSTNDTRPIDIAFTLAYIAFLVCFFLFPLSILLTLDAFVATRITILSEQVRMAMKVHSFVRSNVPKIIEIQNKDQSDDDDDKTVNNRSKRKNAIPKFENYVYFMFAPTLIYKDDYPRTLHIRWKIVVNYCLEIVAVITLAYVTLERVSIPYFSSLELKDITFKQFLHIYHVAVIPASVFFLTIFYGLLHCWMNLCAEILRFGDRQFYLDWWNATSFGEFFRTWNILVQNWIYMYLYRDLNKIFGKNRLLTILFTLLISSLVHDYIISFFLGYIVPIFTIIYTFSLLTISIPTAKNSIWNCLVWANLISIFSMLLCYCSFEWYARHSDQCPRKIFTYIDYLVPRFFYCTD